MDVYHRSGVRISVAVYPERGPGTGAGDAAVESADLAEIAADLAQ